MSGRTESSVFARRRPESRALLVTIDPAIKAAGQQAVAGIGIDGFTVVCIDQRLQRSIIKTVILRYDAQPILTSWVQK
jgi:hypothetical protein